MSAQDARHSLRAAGKNPLTVARHTLLAAGKNPLTVARHSLRVAWSELPLPVDLRYMVNFISTSTDPDGIIVSHAWEFGDGDTSSQVSPSHIYPSGGVYTATLTVTDDDGATDTVSHDVMVPAGFGRGPFGIMPFGRST